MVWFGGSSAPVVIGAAALTIVALFRAVLQMRLADPPWVGRGSCQWRTARARSSRQPFARLGILNLAKNATRACKTARDGKRASRRIAKLLALDLLAPGAITVRRSAEPDHGQLVARFLPDCQLSS